MVTKPPYNVTVVIAKGYNYEGIVVAEFFTLSGQIRFVVEDCYGCHFIWKCADLRFPKRNKERSLKPRKTSRPSARKKS